MMINDRYALFFSFFLFKQKTVYEMRISDWSSDVCSSDLRTITMPGMRAFFAKEAGDGALSEGCRAALSDFTSSADNTFTGIIQTVTSKLNLWINPIVDRATAESDFSLTDL